MFIFVRLLVSTPNLNARSDVNILTRLESEKNCRTNGIWKGEARELWGIDFGTSLMIGPWFQYLAGNIYVRNPLLA
jgi:hypothetical protein